jgi:hypothetical protein
MFTLLLVDYALYLVNQNGTLHSAASYLKRERALRAYFENAEYLDDLGLLSNDSGILS